MTTDRDEGRQRALEQALTQGREYAAAKGRDHAESALLTRLHVEGLQKLLLPRVRTALRGELASRELATELMSDARTVATWLLRTAAVDANALDAAGHAPSSPALFRGGVLRLKQLLGLDSQQAGRLVTRRPLAADAVEERLVDALEEGLKNVSSYEVGPEEIDEHAGDLARLLISNWFGVLEDAVEQQPGQPVKLEYRAFPPAVSAGSVTEGCEAFALPAQLAISTVLEYQKSLARPGESVRLSPLLCLYRSRNGPWYAVHAKRPEVLETLRSGEELAPPRFRDAVARANEAFSPLAIGRAMQLQSRLSLNMAQVHHCAYVAADIVRRRLQAGLNPGTEGGLEEPLDPMSSQLTRHLAHAVIEDLEALVGRTPLHWAGKVQKARRAASLLSEEEDNPVLGEAYMLALPATAVLLAQGGAEGALMPAADGEPAIGYAPELERQLLSTTVAIITSAMVEASEQSGHDALGRRIRTLMEPGQEPSGFALLSGD